MSVMMTATALGAFIGVGAPAAHAATATSQLVSGVPNLYAVACPSAGNCVAIGSSGGGFSGASPVGYVVPITNGSPGPVQQVQGYFLYGIACETSQLCLAVGGNPSGPVVVPVVNGAAGSPQPVSGATQLNAIACPTSNSCLAVGTNGQYQQTSGQGVIVPITGQSPGQPIIVAAATDLESISCRSANDCVSVGTGGNQGANGVVYFADGGGAQAAPTFTNPNGGLGSISCSSSTWCLMSGQAQTTSGLIPISGSQVQMSAVKPVPSGEGLYPGACGVGGGCVGVGSSNSQPMAIGLAEDGTQSSSPLIFNYAGGVLDSVACPGSVCTAVGTAQTSSGGAYQGLVAQFSPPPIPGPSGVPQQVACSPSNPGSGYRFVARDGGIFTYGNQSFCGSTGNIALAAPIVGMATTPDRAGYWLVASDGGIFAFGDAAFHGSTGAMHLAQPIVGMASTPDGGGYWLVASDGGIFTFGDAHFFGSTGALHLAQPIVGMASTPDGGGYWLVARDGGIFTFGDAHFFGSTGAIKLNRPIVGMAATPDAGGYTMVASDGGIFTFGDAHFFGSAGSLHLNAPIVSMARTPDGGGYWLVASDGGIFTYGDAGFFGSAGAIRLAQPIVGMSS
ncbi:MAG TPA: hypothetical protein VFA11_12955 [Acidimicrobiales bacterium]|nr:hypothetical protein [Acidimicrobiales bacterium]